MLYLIKNVLEAASRLCVWLPAGASGGGRCVVGPGRHHGLLPSIHLGQHGLPAHSLALCPRPLVLLGSAAPRSP